MTPPSQNDEGDERSFLQRFGFVLGIAGLGIIVAVIFLGQSLSHHTAAAPRPPEVTMVRIVATPPPPPPPPPPQPKLVEEKMVEQMPVDSAEQKPEESSHASAADLGTNITGAGGPDAFGLSGSRGGGMLGGSGARGGGSRWGWYAGQVQVTIGEALRKNPHTRDASFRVEVRIWPDLTGRITRAQLATSTGDLAVDSALKGEVLTGLQLKEPPPAGMPTPIVMRLTARRPN